ncbi:MAG: ABC transporter permease [Ignavibacteria bacterium]|jgi:ABC-2 type transport system permease protein|nr:ABC transporter permease [Ignavibacteria bacterium]
MKRFMSFVRKEFLHIIRDYRTLLILFGMPVAQIMLFGYAITNEIRDVKIAILDMAKDDVTQEISNKILSSGYFVSYENLNTTDDIEPAFRKGIIKEVVVFEPNFGKNLEKEKHANVQIIADASDPNLANMMIGYTSSILENYQAGLSGDRELPPIINPEIKMLYNQNLKSVYMFVPGLISVLLLLVSALMTSISITKEKELGTMEILLVSPLNPFQIIAGKVIPYLLLSIINTSVVLILSYFVFKVPISGSVVLLMGISILFLITSLSLGILISTLSNSQQTAMMVSLVALILPTIIMSGFIFPIDNMPLLLRILSNIIPSKWFIIIVRGVMLKGVDISYIWFEMSVLVLMTFVLTAISIKKFKIRLE